MKRLWHNLTRTATVVMAVAVLLCMVALAWLLSIPRVADWFGEGRRAQP